MPVAKRETEGRVPTLTELIVLRRTVPPPTEASRSSLAERFLLPPFSVLNAREGWWQNRKRAWIDLGIQSELGRGETPSTSARVGPEDEPTYRTIGGRRKTDGNGLLGFSEQACSHYRANATPGGAPWEAATLKGGRTQRGDGRGRPLARTFGSGGPGDLGAGFKERGAHPIPGGGTGKNSAYLFRTEDGYKSLKDIQTAALHNNPYRQPGQETKPAQSGTSIFDPVLCELAYRWFCPPGGMVLDPFAGGSVRGIVAARLRRGYVGMDLRPEQAAANEVQRGALCPDADLRWVVGDAMNVGTMCPGEYDFIFSCPPYADLERYSDDPRDLSTMDYERFLGVYGQIISASCSMLKEDRFACFVVGDVRDRVTGFYRGFVGDTIAMFRAVGLELYNEMILVTAIGSLPIRVGKQFAGYRKLGKTHQNVLVFVKGDPARAAEACGDVDVSDLRMPPLQLGSVAICARDAAGLASERLVGGNGEEVVVIPLPTVEACLLADVLRGEARALGAAEPRIWVGGRNGWQRVEAGTELTYIVGGGAYLNRTIFSDAQGPADTAPVAHRLRGM